MKFTKQFVVDMNACEDSIKWFDKNYQDKQISYYDVLNALKKNDDVPEDQRLPWIVWTRSLQTNPEAIKYGNRYSYLEEYRVVCPQFTQDFKNIDVAKNEIKNRKLQYYSTSFNGGYFSFSQVENTKDGMVIKELKDISELEQNNLIQVHALHGTTKIVSKDKLQEYLDSEIRYAKDKDKDLWSIYQKVKDIDDGFVALEFLMNYTD